MKHIPNAETVVAIEAGERGEVTRRFDPSWGDAEMLAILLWDFFGPHLPREPLTMAVVPEASAEQVSRYRECAVHIAHALRFYRNIEFDAAQGTEARRAETIGSVHDGPVSEGDAPNG